MAMRVLTTVLTGCALLAPLSAYAQQTPAARPPSRTPLGTRPAEVLMSKITVSDLEKSYDFYTRIIGLKPAISQYQLQHHMRPERPTNDPDRHFVEVGLNFSGSFADAFFDIVQQPGEMPTRAAAKSVVIGFKVPDPRAIIERARQAGYEIVRDAPQVNPGEMAIGFIRDPDGYTIELIQAASYPPRRGG